MERIVAIGKAAGGFLSSGGSVMTRLAFMARWWWRIGGFPQARPALAAVRSRPNWMCRNACFVAGLADSWRIGTATLAKKLERLAAKLCGVSPWRGTLWRDSQEPRETRLKDAGAERRRSALRSLSLPSRRFRRAVEQLRHLRFTSPNRER